MTKILGDKPPFFNGNYEFFLINNFECLYIKNPDIPKLSIKKQ